MKRFHFCLLAVFLPAAWACRSSTGPQGHSHPVGNEIVTVAGNGSAGYSGDGGPAVQAQLNQPFGVVRGPDGALYICDTESHSIRMVDQGRGTLELVAGTGEPGDGPEGDPLTCKMGRPHGVFADSDGSVLVGDTNAHRVRVIRSRKKHEG